MCKERIVFFIAGMLVLSGVAGGYFISPWFFLLAVLPGANMIVASLTGFCPLTKILNKLRVEHCTANSPLD